MLHLRSLTPEHAPSSLPGLPITHLSDPRPVVHPEFAVSGLAPAALIETARGPVLARDLKTGDMVITRDHGLQPLRWAGASSVAYDDAAGLAGNRRPVRIRAGACGTNADAGNLLLAPGQRLLVRNTMNELYFASDEVIAAAGDLTHLDGVDFVSRISARWVHLLFDSHELIRANGIWTESFVPDMWSIRVSYPEKWDEITEAMPRLRFEGAAANFVDTRLPLDSREARLIDAI